MTPAIDPRVRALLFVILAGSGAAAAADTAHEEAQAWLRRASEAAATLNYDGVFVYRNGDSMESVRIIHRAGPEGSRARLVALTGEAREVIRDANRVTCIFPDSGAVLVSNSKPRTVTGFSVFNPLGPFSEHYALALTRGERVAGRSTRLINVAPKDAYRYGYRLSVDETTGFVLKSELIDAGGAPLEQIVYTTLAMPSEIPDELLRPSVDGEGFTWYTSDAPESGPRESGWQVGWLPSGFRMRDRATDPAAFGRMPVEHLVYTDGLASVSVFIEEMKAPEERLEGLSRMGAVSAYGAMVDGFQVTAVGEVPAATVERIGRSVTRR